MEVSGEKSVLVFTATEPGSKLDLWETQVQSHDSLWGP